MEQFWETLRQIGNDFVQNTGLAIVRTIAFFVLGWSSSASCRSSRARRL